MYDYNSNFLKYAEGNAIKVLNYLQHVFMIFRSKYLNLTIKHDFLCSRDISLIFFFLLFVKQITKFITRKFYLYFKYTNLYFFSMEFYFGHKMLYYLHSIYLPT